MHREHSRNEQKCLKSKGFNYHQKEGERNHNKVQKMQASEMKISWNAISHFNFRSFRVN